MSSTSPQQDEPTNDDSVTIWLKMPYCGDQSKQLLKSIEGKLIKCVRPGKKLFFKTVYTITKGQFFTNNKDRTPVGLKANVVYISVALVVLHNILGKDRNLHEPCVEHATTNDSAIHNQRVQNWMTSTQWCALGDNNQRNSRMNCEVFFCKKVLFYTFSVSNVSVIQSGK